MCFDLIVAPNSSLDRVYIGGIPKVDPVRNGLQGFGSRLTPVCETPP